MSMRRTSLLALMMIAACGGSKPKTTQPDHNPTGSGSDVGEAPKLPPGGEKPMPPATAIDDKMVLGLDPSIKKGVLPNGLTYYVKHNNKPEHRVQLWLAVNSGSVLETDQEQGYSHLLEHIAFQGTKRFPKHDIQDFIEKSGMKFGADLNAYTIFDETVYQLMVPTDDPKTVDKGIDVLRDWSHDMTIDNKAVLDERKIIEEERRTRNSAGYRMLMQLVPNVLKGSKYAERLPIGTVEMIAAANADKLRALYQKWYRPEQMAVIIVGDVDAAAMEAEVKTKFADVPKTPPGATPRPTFPIETALPPRFAVARDKEQAVVDAGISYQMPHRNVATVGDMRRELVEQMFLHLVNSRFAIITKRATSSWTGAGARIGAGLGALRPFDEISLEAQVKTGKALDAIGDLTAEMARIRQHGFSATEIDEARAALLQQFDEAAKEVDTHDSRGVASEIVKNYLTGEALAGPVKELELANAILPTITNDQLVAIAKAMGEKGRVVTIEAPLKVEVPTEAQASAKIAEMQDKPIGEWQAVDLSQPLIAAEPKPGAVTSEKQLTNGVTMWTLSNGAVVYLKPTDFKKDEINVTAVSNGGSSQVSDKDYPQIQFAAQVVNASGFGNYGIEELEKKLAGKKVQVETEIDDQQERVSAVAAPQDLEPAMQLLYAAFTAPRQDQGAFEAWRALQLQAADGFEANAQSKFIIGAFDFLFQGNQRVPLPFPTKKRIEAIKLDQVIKQYKARYANAADFAFVVVGAFEPAKVKPLFEKYVASLPATKQPKEKVKDTGLRIRPGVVEKTIKAGTEAKSMSILVSANQFAWSPAVELDSKILGNVLEIEMLALLREKLGGTYSPNAQAEASRNPPQQGLTLILFENDPARAKEMQTEAWKALDALATTPVKDDTIAKAKEQLQKTHDAELLKNDFWESSLIRVARYGDDLDKLVKLDLSTVTAAHVKEIAAKFITKKNRATMTLLPEDAAPPAAPAAPAKK